jgi:hypothetical protein
MLDWSPKNFVWSGNNIKFLTSKNIVFSNFCSIHIHFNNIFFVHIRLNNDKNKYTYKLQVYDN